MKKPTRVCVILPRLPPCADGLGDYTIQIWRHFHNQQEQASTSLDKDEGWHFLTADGTKDSEKHFPLASIRQLPGQAIELANELEATDTVLLQFSGYGYDRNALPFFLKNGLERWLKTGSNRRLVTMFHELYAFGPPWKKAFWLSPAQRRLTKELCQLSDVSVTSNHDYLEKLQESAHNRDIRLIPIGTNFSGTKILPKDWTRLCIFGKQRLDSLTLHGQLITYLAKQNLIRTVVLCGEQDTPANRAQELDLLKRYGPKIKIEEVYDLPIDNVPDTVARCGFSITNVNSDLLAKSTRFQLACALGQVTLSLKGRYTCLPLLDSVSLLEYERSSMENLRTKLTSTAMLESIAKEARRLSETEFSWKHNAAKWREIIQ